MLYFSCGSFLDALRVEVCVVVHRMWEPWRFEVGVDLSVPLLLLWAVWMTLRMEYGAICLSPVLCVVFPLGLDVVMAVASILAVGAGLWHGRWLLGYLFWLLAVLGALVRARGSSTPVKMETLSRMQR